MDIDHSDVAMLIWLKLLLVDCQVCAVVCLCGWFSMVGGYRAGSAFLLPLPVVLHFGFVLLLFAAI